MTQARQRAEWDRTSSILSILFNSNRDPASKAMMPWEFNPYIEAPKPIKMSAHMLHKIMGRKADFK